MAVWIAPRPGGPRAARYFLQAMTVTTDTFLPAVVNAGMLANSLLAAETLEGVHTDAMAQAESLSMTRGDASEPVVFSITQVGDSRHSLESLGAASILGDEFAPFEMLGRQQSDVFPLVENNSSQRFDANATVEATFEQRSDSNKPAEALAGQRSDAALLAETLGTLRGDSTPVFETLAGPRSDASPAAEALAGQRADSSLRFEALTRALHDANVPLESAGSASLARDQFVALESLVGQHSNPQGPTAWEASVLFDGRAFIEFTATAGGGAITADARALIEWLVRQTADARAAVQLAATAGNETPNQAEVLARAVREASSKIETLGQSAAFVNAFLAVEAECELDIANVLMCESLKSSAGASLAVHESWITPLVQIALGRLLKSPGKIRILTGWKR